MLRVVFFVVLLIVAGCNTLSVKGADEVKVPVHTAVLMLPLRDTVSGDADGASLVFKTLFHELESNGYRVMAVDLDTIESEWRKASEIVGGVYSSLTGKKDTEKFMVASKNFMSNLAKISGASLVISPEIVLREAELSGRKAYWDGVIRRVAVRGGSQGIDWSGEAAAFSLSINAFNPSGSLEYSGFGGLSLQSLTTRIRVSPTSELRKAPLSNVVEVLEAVEISLAGLKKL